MNRLDVWRRRKGMTFQALADKVGVTHAATARAWCLPFDHKDFRTPPMDTRLHLQEASGGAVAANYWLGAVRGAGKKEGPSVAS
jgi:transcriptional regulator with XRE-family HTH domain